MGREDWVWAVRREGPFEGDRPPEYRIQMARPVLLRHRTTDQDWTLCRPRVTMDWEITWHCPVCRRKVRPGPRHRLKAT